MRQKAEITIANAEATSRAPQRHRPERATTTPSRVSSPREAYERCLPEMKAIPADRLIRINVDIGATITIGLVAVGKVMPLRDELMRTVTNFDASKLDRLEEYTWALAHAQSMYSAAAKQSQPLGELVSQGTQLRDVLLHDVLSLAGLKFVDERAVPMMLGGNAYKNVASDLMALNDFYRKQWLAIEPKTRFGLEELSRAETLAKQILTMIAAREQATSGSAEVAEMRVRAFTLFLSAYEEVQRVVACVRYYEGDASALTPSVYANRRRRGTDAEDPPRSPDQTNEPDTAGPAHVVPAPPSTSGDRDGGPFTS